MNKTKFEPVVAPSESNVSKTRVSVPLDPLEYEAHLNQCHDHLSWLQALFIAIQSDPDIEPGLNIRNLASIGGHLSQNWLNQIETLQKVTVG